MSIGTRGDISALASARLRCAKVMPRSSSTSTRSSANSDHWSEYSHGWSGTDRLGRGLIRRNARHLQYLVHRVDPGRAQSEIDRWQWLGRIGQPVEVGYVVVFLASSGANSSPELVFTSAVAQNRVMALESGWEPPSMVP